MEKKGSTPTGLDSTCRGATYIYYVGSPKGRRRIYPRRDELALSPLDPTTPLGQLALDEEVVARQGKACPKERS